MPNDYRNQPNLDRGIRNNNPGNITIGDNWQGMVGNDGTFLIFADMGWGVRAIGKSLINMIGKGYNTIATLIPQWSLTDQAAYISNVSAATGLDPNEQLGTDSDTIQGLIQAIIQQENGAQASYVTSDDIAAGMALINNGLSSTVQAIAVQAYNEPTTTFMYVALIALGAFVITKAVQRKK